MITQWIMAIAELANSVVGFTGLQETEEVESSENNFLTFSSFIMYCYITI